MHTLALSIGGYTAARCSLMMDTSQRQWHPMESKTRASNKRQGSDSEARWLKLAFLAFVVLVAILAFAMIIESRAAKRRPLDLTQAQVDGRGSEHARGVVARWRCAVDAMNKSGEVA
jgi:hypothetical protein